MLTTILLLAILIILIIIVLNVPISQRAINILLLIIAGLVLLNSTNFHLSLK